MYTNLIKSQKIETKSLLKIKINKLKSQQNIKIVIMKIFKRLNDERKKRNIIIPQKKKNLDPGEMNEDDILDNNSVSDNISIKLPLIDDPPTNSPLTNSLKTNGPLIQKQNNSKFSYSPRVTHGPGIMSIMRTNSKNINRGDINKLLLMSHEFGDKIYYKYVNQNMQHYNYVYKDFYNKLPDNEKFDPHNEHGGGLHFCDIEDLPEWLYMFSSDCMIYEVTVPDNANVCAKIKKYKSDRIIISNPLPINEFIKYHNVEILFVTLHGPSLRYVDTQTNELCRIAVQQDGFSLKYVKKQTNELCIKAIEQYAHSLKYVKNQTDEICSKAIERNIHTLQHIKNQTYEQCLFAIECDGYALKYVQPERRTYELYLLAVKTCGVIIQFIDLIHHTNELFTFALKQNGLALQYIDPLKCTNEMYLIALNQNGLALQYIDPSNHTYEMCVKAVKQNGSALEFVKLDMRSQILEYLRFNKK